MLTVPEDGHHSRTEITSRPSEQGDAIHAPDFFDLNYLVRAGFQPDFCLQPGLHGNAQRADIFEAQVSYPNPKLHQDPPSLRFRWDLMAYSEYVAPTGLATLLSNVNYKYAAPPEL